MQYQRVYEPETLTRDALDGREGLTLVEFGANWCGYCIAAQPDIEKAVNAMPEGSHLKIEDGPGRRLGRSFRVKLWPTLIAMRDGQEIGRAVRPDQNALTALLATII